MARSRKPSGSDQLKTGNQFIEKAREAGAQVSSHRGGFTKVSTPTGSTYITPGDTTLDKRTRKNLKHWFRLLGLLAMCGIMTALVDFVWGLLNLPPIG